MTDQIAICWKLGDLDFIGQIVKPTSFPDLVKILTKNTPINLHSISQKIGIWSITMIFLSVVLADWVIT